MTEKLLHNNQFLRPINLKKHTTHVNKAGTTRNDLAVKKIFLKFYSNFQFMHIYPSNGQSTYKNNTAEVKKWLRIAQYIIKIFMYACLPPSARLAFNL